MARVLHLFKGDHAAEASAVIAAQTAAGDEVTVALLEGESSALPAGVTIQRVPGELSYERLAELVFAADHVVTW
jgi:predicted transcriptional regulator